MNKALSIALKLLGLNRAKPKTKYGKMVRRSEHAVTALAMVYILIQFFPQVVFTHTVQAHDVQMYSSDPIAGDAERLLAEVKSRVGASTLYRPEDRFTVFLCNSRRLYTFFAPFSRGGFAVTIPTSRHIFIADADIGRNQSRRFGSGYNTRSLVSVVAHEAGHVLIRRRFGFWKEWILPTWLKEGYCEVLARESSFPEKEGDSLLAHGEDDASGSFTYFAYRRMVEYLMEEKGKTIEELICITLDEQKVRNEIHDWIHTKAIEQPAEELQSESALSD